MCVGAAFEEFAAEQRNNCLKGVQWSPDGLCLLTASEDCQLRLFEPPTELPEDEPPGVHASDSRSAPAEMRSVLQVRESGTIYDYAWYPYMDSNNPASCCFISSSREQPIHLWDAYTGACRASYIPYNHLDEVIAAQSVAFDPSGQRIFCGFERAIRIFDLTRPGRDCEMLATSATRRSRKGQRGIISCFAFAPDVPGLYAAGSYSGTIGVYSEGSADGLIVELSAHTGGVTQCAFSHDGRLLYSAARRDGAIRCWDVRMSCRVLATYERACPTNQHVGFELRGAQSEGLLSASQDGRVLIFDTNAPDRPPTTLLTFADATNAVAAHPQLPLLAVAVGERRFPLSEEECANGEDPYVNGLSVWRLPQVRQQEHHEQEDVHEEAT